VCMQGEVVAVPWHWSLVPSPRLPIKPRSGQSRTGRAPVGTADGSTRRWTACAPLRETPSSSSFRHSPVLPRSSTRPPQPPRATSAASQTGAPPERGAPRPGSLGAAGRPATGVPPPFWGHKPVHGRPLFLLHPSPAKFPTGMAQFRRDAAPSTPRDHIASLSLILGCFSWTRDLFAIET
jgi:hypothetical protein